MGWDSFRATHRYKNGSINRKAECDEMMSNVLRSAMVGSVYYAACARKTKDGTGDYVFGVVGITRVESKEYFDFFVKFMDEGMGPYESKCPEAILDLLTPTESEYALQWREKCRDYHAERKAEKNNPMSFKNLPEGTRVVWTVGSDNWNGIDKGDTLLLEKTRVSSNPRSRVYWLNRTWRLRFQPKDIPASEIVLYED